MRGETELAGLIDRRRFLQSVAAAATVSIIGRCAQGYSPADSTRMGQQRYKIAACDWMMLKRQKLGAVKWAKDCGMDGVEIDLGGLGDRETFDNKLLDPTVREQFQISLKEAGLECSSLAMSGFYAQSFAERPTVPKMMDDCIETMKLMNVTVAFLPLGVRSDLKAKPELRPAVVEKLRDAGKKAEAAGVIIGIETALDAAGDVELLKEIDSPAIKIYFNFANALQNDRDLVSELRTLGKERICQIHCTNQDQFLIENDPKMNMPKVKAALDEMGWSGWLVIERSREAGKGNDVKYNFSSNAKYLKSIFQT